MNTNDMNNSENMGQDDQNTGQDVRAYAYAARDALGLLEALWIDDKDRARAVWEAASDEERWHMAGALASMALLALRTPEDTPPGIAVGIWTAMFNDGLADVERAGL